MDFPPELIVLVKERLAANTQDREAEMTTPKYMCESTDRIHSFLTWVRLSISQELQGSVSATTKSRLVFSILFAWNSLRGDSDGW